MTEKKKKDTWMVLQGHFLMWCLQLVNPRIESALKASVLISTQGI